MKDSLLIIIILVCFFSAFMSILIGGYYFYFFKKEGDECEGKDKNGSYVIDEDGDCVLDECDDGYKMSFNGKTCIRNVISKPLIEEAAASFSRCEEIDGLMPIWKTEEVKAYCNKQQYCNWLDNTCKSIVKTADGSTLTVIPGSYSETDVTSTQLTNALNNANNPSQSGGTQSKADEIQSASPAAGKGGEISLRIPSVGATETPTDKPNAGATETPTDKPSGGVGTSFSSEIAAGDGDVADTPFGGKVSAKPLE